MPDTPLVWENAHRPLNEKNVMAETQTITGLHDLPASPNADAGGRFEDECIDLLCKQENTLSLLGEASNRQRVLESLDLAKKMILSFLDFAESHFDTIQFRCVGQRLYTVNQRTSDYEKMLVAKSFRFLRRMVGMTVPTDEAMRHTHEQLRSDYMDLYNDFFLICAKRFPEDSVIREQFLASVATFLSEFNEQLVVDPASAAAAGLESRDARFVKHRQPWIR